MNLRKVCNHPFLFGSFLNQKNEDFRDINPDFFINCSGKFSLLNRIINKMLFKNNNKLQHKILIFSQFTIVLDLLEDYFHYKKLSYFRFDGSTDQLDRQEMIDQFNDPNNDEYNIFLLSTRSGGQGVNLTSADTVILFDSDWNPHMDSQAQDRCHRIGQTKDVVVYRFVTIGTVEIDIIKKQISKKKLERLTISSGDFRKAGTRLSKKLELNDIKKLLSDDIKSLETRKKIDDKHDIDNTNISLNDFLSTESISDKELDIVLDRDLIFSLKPSERDYEALNEDDEIIEDNDLEGEFYDIIDPNLNDAFLSIQ